MLGRLTSLGRYITGLAAIVLITLFFHYEASFAITTVVLTYLLAILIASAVWGLGVSVFMSAVATLTVDYFFLPPVGRLTISDPQDWVSLTAFLVVSVIGSDLSARARRQAAEADRRRNEAEQLYEFSRHLLKARDPLKLLNAIPRQIVTSFEAEAAKLYLPDKAAVFCSGLESSQLDDVRLRAAAVRGGAETDRAQNVYFAPVHLGSQAVGSFGISGSLPSDQSLDAMGTLITIAIDRAQAIELLGKAEAVRENERLKSVLLDAITHDFKTPLTSIKAAATGLLEDLNFDREQQKELLVVIDEECDRISRLIGETAEMSRLEAGEVTLQFASRAVGELISAVLEDYKNVKNTRPLRTEVPNPERRVAADLEWVRKVFANLIQNADLYSTPGESITISAKDKDGFVAFSVADKGPGIEESELSEIFYKFYRGKGQRHRIPGTGMGLSIAKAIVEAHGGTIEVTSQPGMGSVFTFYLPMDREATEGE